ncbi:MAG: amidohydrolase family protein [Brucellaceae bacterium]|jgi:cytosine/adenosine deaminase-related metal-dependent hydrolase|nr:amidohydrolase family protein [Brucellaceae bacterium]
MPADFLLSKIRPQGGVLKDVLIKNGKIVSVTDHNSAINHEALEVVDGYGQLMLPSLIDAHTHLDKTLLGMPWYRNDVGTELIELIENERAMKRELRIDPQRQSARQIEQAISYGTTYIRTHVDIDTEYGLSGLEGVVASREKYRDLIDIQIVAFPQSGMLIRPGTVELMEAAMQNGADIVGGLDPSEVDRDAKGHLDTVFSMAQRYGKPVDIHLHEPDSLGAYAIEMIIERTNALGMAGQVTISHGFCLGMLADKPLAALGAKLAKAGIHLMVKGGASSAAPPVFDLTAMGVNICSGSDGIRDTWSPFGNADMLERAAIVSQRNDFRSDENIELALNLATYGGARMMDIADYGIQEGCDASFILLNAETPADAVASRPVRSAVYRKGALIAKEGKLITPR